MSETRPDAFARLADALRTMARNADGTIGADDRTRNLLLDACGSDYRMLVELVLGVRTDVRAALPQAAPSIAWETQRAPIVHQLVATRYLQPDIARWLVDAWAYALDLRAMMPDAPSVQYATGHDARPMSAAASAITPSPSAARSAAGSAARAHTMRQTSGLPGWAASPARTTRVPRATTTRMTPAELARIKKIERVSLIVLAMSVIVGFGAEGWALHSRPVDRLPVPTAASEPSTVTSSTPAPVISPLVSADSVSRAAVGSVAGRYRVEHSQVSVGGTDGCDEVARALALQRPSVEIVEHTTGSATIRWASRGLAGVIEPDGRFTTGPDSGVTDGVRWTFIMTGRFSRDGFVAQTQKTTDAVLAWHKSRSCSVVATLNGTRVGG